MTDKTLTKLRQTHSQTLQLKMTMMMTEKSERLNVHHEWHLKKERVTSSLKFVRMNGMLFRDFDDGMQSEYVCSHTLIHSKDIEVSLFNVFFVKSKSDSRNRYITTKEHK